MRLARLLIFVSAVIFVNTFKAQIVIKGAIDHLNPGSTDTTGNINLLIYGGTAPYDFSWTKNYGNDAGTTQDLNNVSKGYYKLNITDANNINAAYSYNLGYKVNWSSLNGIAENNDTIYIDGSPATNAPSAVGANILPANTDGWTEFVLQQAANSFFLGFCDNAYPDVVGSWGDIEFGVYAVYGNLYAYVGGSFNWIAFLVTGDVITVQRVGELYYICQNSNYLYALPANISKSLRLKAVIDQPMVNVGCSFDGSDSGLPFSINPLASHLKSDGKSTSGTIALNASGGTTPYTCLWTPGGNGTILKNAAPGHYKANLSDASSHIVERVYSIGYKPLWSKFGGMANKRDTLVKIETDPPINEPMCISENILKPDQAGWVELIAPEHYDTYLIGFSDWRQDFDANSGIHDIRCGVYLTEDRSIYAYTDGWNMQYIGHANAGDALRIERTEYGAFIIKQNDVALFNCDADMSRQFFLKAHTYGNISLKNIGCSFQPPFSASFVKTTANADDPLNGGVTIYPYGAKGPFTVTWADSSTGSYKPRLMPGRYTVTIADSTRTDSITKIIDIGSQPSWAHTRDIVELPDTLLQYRGSRGISIAGNTSAPDEPSSFEMKLSKLAQDVLIGFAGAPNNLQTQDEIDAGHLNDFLNSAATSADDLYAAAINNNISYDEKNNMKIDDKRLNFVRANNGLLTIYKDGISSSQNTFSYDEGDVIKVGRDDTGTLFVSNNDRVLYRERDDQKSTTDQYLYPVLAINSTVISPALSIASGPITYPPVFVPLTMFAKPSRKLDGGFCTAVSGRVYFSVEGEYNLTQLKYKVYDKTNNVVMSNANSGVLNTTWQVLGDNRHYLNVSSLANGVYILEVTNEKNEKQFLRFKQYPASTNGTGTSNQN